MKIAVILSLGMLNQSVNINSFIQWISQKATEKDPNFKLTAEFYQECNGISEAFNRNEINPEKFMTALQSRLGTDVPADEFWNRWNATVTVGKVEETIVSLKFFCVQNNALLYFNSDINRVHLEKLQAEYTQHKIELDCDSRPGKIDQFRLYASCQYGKSKFELTQQIVEEIQLNKNFNRPDRIILVQGDPDNIQNAKQKAVEIEKVEKLTAWCKDHGVELALHKNARPLAETLNLAVQQPAMASKPDAAGEKLAIRL